MTRPFDPAKHCGGKTNPLNGATPCRQRKGHGTNHPGTGNCKLHGGRSPNGEKAAAKERAERAIEKLGVPRGTGDPFQLLAKTVSHAEGYLEAAAALTREAAAEPAEGTPPPALGLEVAAELYEDAIRTGARVGKAAVDADVANRLAALDERAGALLLRFVRELLDKVVPARQRPELEAWASMRLGELAVEYERPGAVH